MKIATAKAKDVKRAIQSHVGTAKWQAFVPPLLREPLGQALYAYNAGDHKTALYWFGKCAAIDPYSKPVLYFGSSSAASAYQQLRATQPDSPELAGWRECAETLVRAAYEIAPEDAVACHNVGKFLHDDGRDAEAIPFYREAVRLEPSTIESWGNMGAACYTLGSPEEANACWDECLKYPATRGSEMIAQAYILLRREQYPDGWARLEGRWTDRDFLMSYGRQDLRKPLWDGTPLKKKQALLIHGEQGLGDHVQFARYVREVQAKGIPIAGIETQPTLKRWMQGCFPDLPVFLRGDATGFSHHVTSQSLAHLLGTTFDTIPEPVAPPVKPKRLTDGFAVGLVWHGATGNTADYQRSIPHEALRWLKDANVRWVNLQYHPQALLRGRAWLDNDMVDGVSEARDVLDTAAVIKGCDLVVTVDTLVAHLAGSLGVPTIALHRFHREWRWGKPERDRTPWYPSHRMFTQPAPFVWEPVLAEVRNFLRDAT